MIGTMTLFMVGCCGLVVVGCRLSGLIGVCIGMLWRGFMCGRSGVFVRSRGGHFPIEPKLVHYFRSIAVADDLRSAQITARVALRTMLAEDVVAPDPDQIDLEDWLRENP